MSIYGCTWTFVQIVRNIFLLLRKKKNKYCYIFCCTRSKNINLKKKRGGLHMKIYKHARDKAIQIKIFVILNRYTLGNYVLQIGQQKSKTSFKLFIKFGQGDFNMAMKQIFDKVNPRCLPTPLSCNLTRGYLLFKQ